MRQKQLKAEQKKKVEEENTTIKNKK